MRGARTVVPGLAVAAMLAMPPGAAAAQGAPAQDAAARTIQIFRCTDAAGHVTLQNDVPCPEGSRQERQSVDVPPPLPAYVPREERMPEVVAAERAAEAAAIAATVQPIAAASAGTVTGKPDAKTTAAKPGPPPALYACRTWDAVDILTENATPEERCAPLQVVGVDGSVRTDAAACEKVVDQCAAVPAEDLCLSWRRRVDEAEFRWKFAGAKQDDARRREYELLAATLAASNCAR
jgi:hypothetical protein